MNGVRSGFTLIDAAVAIAGLGFVAAIVAAGMSGSRGAARRDFCGEKMQRQAMGSAAFALANQGLIAGFTWQTGGNNSQYPDLNAQQMQGPLQAHSAQAVDIMRRRAIPSMPTSSGWIPNVYYWNLPLADFEDRSLAEVVDVCPSDEWQMKWRRHPQEFIINAFAPYQPHPVSKRNIYRTSYSHSGAAFDRLQSVLTPAAAASRIQNSATSGTFETYGAIDPGSSPMDLVAFPSLKTHFFDTADRHYAARPMNFAHPDARQPIAFFDGSVRVARSGDARTPWQPREPSAPTAQKYLHEPELWEPPTVNGRPVETLKDPYRWTRDGLLGWDFAR